MFELKKGMLMVAVIGGLITTSFAANADSAKDAARDKRGNFVTSTNGNCVRTRWQDNSDPCNPTPPPAPVVVEEKKQEQVVSAKTLQKEQRTIYFDFDKAILTADSMNKLNTVSSMLKADTNVKAARIVGFADRFGSAAYNEKLSQKRAKAVQEYLVSKGYLNVSATETRWLGKSSPITNCPKKAKRSEQISCLANDRRVEVEIDYYK